MLYNEYYVVDYERAVEKTCQALREKKSLPPPNYTEWEKDENAKRRSAVQLKRDVERAKKRRELVNMDKTTTTNLTAAAGKQKKVPATTTTIAAATGEKKAPSMSMGPPLKRPVSMSSKKIPESGGNYFDYTAPLPEKMRTNAAANRTKPATQPLSITNQNAVSPAIPVVVVTVPPQMQLALGGGSPTASYFLQLRLEELRDQTRCTAAPVNVAEYFSSATSRETDVAFILAGMGCGAGSLSSQV